MEGLFVEGHLGEGSDFLTNRMDRSDNRDSDVEDLRSSPPKASSSRARSSDKSVRTPSSTMQQTEGVSKSQTWKDKPGMAKKRKITKKRPYWEMVESDGDDAASSQEGKSRRRNGTSGIQGRNNEAIGSKRVPISYIDFSDANSESASAVETDEGDYREPTKSVKTKGKGKVKAKQAQEMIALPLPKSQKGKEKREKKKRKKKKKGKTGDGKEQSQEAEIKDLSLSSMDNQIWTIGKSILSDSRDIY